MSSTGPLPIPKDLPQRRFAIPAPLRWLLLGLIVAGSLYLVSPYITLWRLNLTSVHGPTSALSSIVDLEAVRDQIQRRLNKDRTSAIGEVSDAFIDWVQQVIRRDDGEALRRAVTLGWVRQILLTHAEGNDGFWPAIHYAFYDSPLEFRVQIGSQSAIDEDRQETKPLPVHLRFERTWLGWRVIAVYY